MGTGIASDSGQRFSEVAPVDADPIGNEYVGVTEQNQQFISRVIAANDRSRGYRVTAVWTQSGALNDKQLREIFDSFQLVPLRSKKR
jgi:hypothetical protein